jgi:uncharacterized protein (DUF2126 family)/transglutaminase-like putative cysteine protease
MTIRAALFHRTTYRYAQPVVMSPQVVRLRPAPHCRTPVPGYTLRIEPEDHFLNWQQDPFGNWQARIAMTRPVTEFTVTVDLVAEMTAHNPFDFFVEGSAEEWPFAYDATLRRDLAPYLAAAPPGPQAQAFLAGVPRTPRRTIDFIVELNRRLCDGLAYLVRMEPGVQTPEETLTKASGSCRDSGWLLVNLARHLGLAARFVSGYLIQLTADEKPVSGPAGPASDFCDLHAWAEVYLPGAGWVGLDPTSGLLAGEGHLPLACTPEPGTAAAITGGFAPAAAGVEKVENEFAVAMEVSRVREAPRNTKPYREDQWQAILAMGDQVDRDLEAQDVRLTVGGEPTFVAVEDPDGKEWNTDALGRRKRELADQLVRRLRTRFAPGALLHFGQGKWYPGEPLPRWALGCFWRGDGVPAWKDPRLIADAARPTGADAAVAGRFATMLAERLGVESRHLIPAYEDAWYYLWRERRLPGNVDPYRSRLDDELERARLARVFTQGLGAVAGYCLPLRRAHAPGGSWWQSGEWFLRDERLRLMPGDSPLGFRLPLDSLPWAEPGAHRHESERDPLAPVPALPPSGAPRWQHPGDAPRSSPASAPERHEPADGIVRTAVCLEARGGHLHVFMPPLAQVEDYLELVGVVEAVAEAIGQPVALEGYPPPRDARLHHLSVTPDPGVIEVNVQPAATWREAVDITTTVYEEARQCGLVAEKFQLDGRVTGTGGGNHLTLGGRTAADSPFLRRPDLLRSLVAYWHNHPALSYLFSGLFIGPTSQAPRADEARTENVYELETALTQLPDHAVCPPWLVDRVMRNLLVDLTGNTHRAEFSIDKLYSPDSASGRLGLLEMRGFEMPPHARMSCAQQLLVRALVARFWRQPYHGRLARWGTALHDRFMLPAYVERDFEDVLHELGAHGFALPKAWFAPHLEFRFPYIGASVDRGVELELRHALEPWSVLGEEGSSTGTARYVDSSLERVQVAVRGLTDGRHAVVCNGVALPLHPTGTVGEAVCGVRFRAWQPPSCLHPTIGVHAPLVFSLVDRWSGRAVSGCTYHVTHPGGRSYDTRPVNANEASGRRLSRFQAFGHAPGPLVVDEPTADADYPLTLDLRRWA